MQPGDEAKIARNAALLKDGDYRQALLCGLAPTFCYHPDEENFPMHPDEFIEQIAKKKFEFYKEKESRHVLSQERERPDRDSEAEEFALLQKYFFNKDGEFIENYRPRDPEALAEFMRVINLPQHYGLFIFDEKKYGIKTGTKIDLLGGVYPPDHPKKPLQKAKRCANSAPIECMIVPTPEGFYIQYDYTYALNNAISGLRWLRNMLPWRFSAMLSHLGFHYGDIEGVGLNVVLDAEGNARIRSMQTFAHGSKGAREVPIEQCTLGPDGRVQVFVGLGGHPAYADNFVGRSIFFDKVGDRWKITPTQCVDCSADRIRTDPTIPLAWSSLRKVSDSNNSMGEPKDYQSLLEHRARWNHQNYQPSAISLFLTNIYQKIRGFFTHTPPRPAAIFVPKPPDRGDGDLAPAGEYRPSASRPSISQSSSLLSVRDDKSRDVSHRNAPPGAHEFDI